MDLQVIEPVLFYCYCTKEVFIAIAGKRLIILPLNSFDSRLTRDLELLCTTPSSAIARFGTDAICWLAVGRRCHAVSASQSKSWPIDLCPPRERPIRLVYKTGMDLLLLMKL